MNATPLNKVAKVFLWIAGGMLLSLAGVTTWIFLNQEQIKGRMVEEINKHLEAEIRVKEIDLAFWQTFPQVSLHFKSISIPEHGPAAEEGLLLDAESVFIQFNLWQILRGDYQIERIEVNKAEAHIRYLPGKGGNFELFKSSEDSTEASPLNLNRIILSNTRISYSDPERTGLVFFKRGNVKLKSHGDSLQLSLRANGDLLSWSEGKTAFPDSIPFEIKGNLSTASGLTRLKNIEFNSGNLALTIEGAFSEGDKRLDITGKRLDLKELTALLPMAYRSFEEEIESKGRLNLEAAFRNGVWNATFSLQQGWLKHKRNNLELNDLNLSGRYLYAKGKNELELTSLSAKSKSGELQATANLHFNPELWMSIQLKANGRIEEWLSFWPDTSWGSANGVFSADLRYEGYPNRPEAMKEARGQGLIEAQNLSLAISKFPMPVSSLTGSVNFREGKFSTSNLRFISGKTNWSLQAELPNFWEVMTGNQASLQIRGKVSADRLELEEWIKAFENPDASAAGGNFELPQNLEIRAGIEIKQLVYKSFTARNVLADFELNPFQLSLKNAVMNSCDGALGGDFYLTETATGFDLTTQVKLTSLQLPEIFKNFRNFGQDKLQGQHLQGVLSGTADLKLPLNYGLKPELEKMVAEVTFVVTKGRLRGFEPLQALSRFIRVEELADIAFDKLTNTVYIREGQFHLPEMEVRSSALNLVISGQHGFDNQVNYRFNLLLRDLLASRFKRSSGDAFGEYAEETGGTRLFLKMTGPADNPQTAYDMAAVGNKIKEDIRNEVREIQQLLRQDMQLFRRDTTSKKQRERRRLREQEGFEFE